jgi:hypothetical protein
LEIFGLLDSFQSVTRLSDDLAPRLFLQRDTQEPAETFVVIDN